MERIDMMIKKWTWVWMGIGILALLFTACDLGTDRYERRMSQRWDIQQLGSFPIPTTLQAKTLNGSIVVRGFEGNHIQIDTRTVVQGFGAKETKEFGDNLQVQFTNANGVLTFWVDDRTPHFITNIGVSLEILVPNQWLKDLYLTTSNGPITIENLRADFDIRTSNGGVTLRNTEGLIQVQTSNGRVTMDRVHLSEGSSTIRSSNGQISFQGELPSNGLLDWRTSNARVTIDVPRDSAFYGDIRTSNGSIQITDLQHVDHVFSRTEFRGSINGGGNLQLRIVSSNGDIALRGR